MLLRFPILIYCGVIFYFSSISQFPGSFSILPDKLGHMIMFSGLGFLVARYLALGRGINGFLLFAFSTIFCLFYGITDELHQYFVPGRTVEIGDLIADGIGGLIGAISYSINLKWNLIPILNKTR